MKTRPSVVAVFERPAKFLYLATFMLFATATLLRAQVSYLGDIALPSGHDFIVPVSGMPYPTNSVSQVLMTVSSFYTLDPSTNTFNLTLSNYPAGVKFSAVSLGTFYSNTAISNSGDFFLMVGVTRQFDYYDLTSGDMPTVAIDFARSPPPAILSFAVNPDSSQVAFVNNNQILQLNANQSLSTATTISSALLVSSTQNGGPITFAGKGAYGPNGLFYLLDQANGVTSVESYDLSAGVAAADRLKGSFTVPSSLSLSAGMAISPSGHIYFGDGTGGFSEYDLSGDHLGDFTFTGPGTNDGNGAPYLDLDRNGDIFVYTPGTGMHEYFDASGISLAIPEPATYATLFSIVALGFAALRRRA